MLNLLEKIQYFLSGLVILLVIGLYLWQGPVTQSKSLVPAVKIEQAKPAPQPAPKKGLAGNKKPAIPAISARDRRLLDDLNKKHKVRARSINHLTAKVNPELVKYLDREANHLSELDKAASQLLPGADGRMTRLKIFKIDADSILTSKLGLQNNDIIEFIDGEQIDFGEDSMVTHQQRVDRFMKKIRSGGSITLTITRNGQPTQIEFKLE